MGKDAEQVRKQRELVGNKYGKLTVIESCGKGKDRHYYSKVRCECGKEYLVPDTELMHGRRSACLNCSKSRKTHGMTKTRLFHIWQSMKQRCNNANHENYHFYGGRGIRVCEEWENSFASFREWSLLNGYSDQLSIDREDANGNYEPNNCRWVDKKTQANNKRSNAFIEYKGKKYTVAQLSDMSGVNYSCLYNRIRSGWDIEKALQIQPKIGRNQHEKI